MSTVQKISIFSLLGLIGIAAAGFYIISNYQMQSDEFSIAGEQRRVAKDASGTIYLSLEAGEPGNFSRPLGIYTFNFSKNQLRDFYVPDTASGEDVPDHIKSGKISPDGEKIATVIRTNTENANQNPRIQVAILDRKTKNIEFTTNAANTIKATPRWAPNGEKIAFAEIPIEERERMSEPDAWTIKTVNIGSGEEEEITSGVQPHFSPDGNSLLILKNEGLHLIGIEDDTDERVWDVNDGFAHNGMKIGLSNDKDMLAWSSANIETMLVFDIHSWEPFDASIREQFSTRAFWPVFSPDNQYLAFQEVDSSAEINEGRRAGNPRLVVYDFESGEKQTIVDLSDFYQQAMWINDWAK